MLNAWSDESVGVDGGVLSDLYLFLCEEEGEDWILVFRQLYSWQYQSFHEGSDTYYSNLYEDNDYLTQLKVAKYLKENGYLEVYNVFKEGICNYNEMDEATEAFLWTDEIRDIDEWIDANDEAIYNCIMDILLINMRQLFV